MQIPEKGDCRPEARETGPRQKVSTTKSRTWNRYRHGWRFTVATGACLSFAVLWLNVGIFLGAQKKDAASNNIINIFEGTCSKRDRTITLYHFGVNVLSTLLLSASSSCMQVLGAPTREDIDSWHSRGDWLDIGVISLRNLRRISKWRVGLVLLFGLSSIPLHLVYNSIIFGTQNNSQFVAILVTQDFVNGGTFEPTAAIMPLCNHTSSWPAPPSDDSNKTTDSCVRKNYEGQAPNAAQLQQTQLNIASLERLENSDCVKTFQNLYEPQYRSVFLVSNITDNTDSVLQFLDTSYDSGLWMCANDWAKSVKTPAFEIVDGDSSDGFGSTTSGGPSYSCNPKTLASNATDWQMFDPSAADPSSLLSINYCLAERSKISECTIGFSKVLMLIVIVFNTVKFICFILALKICTSPLITIGDAVASFLENPDATTSGFGTHSVKNIRGYRIWKALRDQNPGTIVSIPPVPVSSRWEAPKRRLWREAASLRRLFTTFGLCFVFLFLTLILWGNDGDDHTVNDDSFGSINGSNLLVPSRKKSLGIDILLANLPQLFTSLTYGFYNGYLTLMLQSVEYLRFSDHRKALRVSVPDGAQRSTFWLNIPYRYAVPLMIAMALLHWLISQSVFLARTYVWDYNYAIDDQYTISGTGYSNLAILLAFNVGLLMILTLWILANLRSPTNMPLAGSNSAAISAACHRQETEDSDMVLRPLQYGVLSSTDREGRKRVGFSAEDVEPLVSGEVYV